MSARAAASEHPARRIPVLLHAVFFVAGFTAVFVSLGATASLAGQVLAEHKLLLMRVSGAVVVLLGLNMLGVFRLTVLARDLRLHVVRRRVSYSASFVAGIAFAAGWTPCIGPVRSAVLALAGATASVWHGMSLLLVYSLGLGVPFLVLALGLRYAMPMMTKGYAWLRVTNIIGGITVVASGLVLASGSFVQVVGWIYAHAPALANVGTGPGVMAGVVTYTAAFVAGLVSCISPCVFPLLPGYLSFLAGQSAETLP